LGSGSKVISVFKEFEMMRLVWIAVVAAALTACSSAVKLDNVPVEDRTGSSIGAGNTSAATTDGSAVSKGGVAPVDLSKGKTDSALQNTTRIVYFDYDSFAIRSEFQAVIEAHAKFIKADRARKVTIEGHTDERGGREYNLALGQKRAEAVRRALTLLGVAEAQLEAVSFGKEKPAVLGDSDAAMEKNRRAEINYR
jgi:peptidoglycan-associated lipoprotein